MRVSKMFDDYERKLKELDEYREKLIEDYKIAKENTRKFLKECEKVGIKIVSIGTKTNKIKSSREWSYYCEGSIFADEKYNDWPAIWKVAEMENDKYNGGCGNGGQHEFDCTRFVEGIYEFKDGKWRMLLGGEE